MTLYKATTRLRQLCPILQKCTLVSYANPTAPLSTHTDLIQITPKVSLFDQKLHVRVHDLPSKAKVTLHLTTQQEWRKKPAVFSSCGHFVTSDEGDLDLYRDVSSGGTYTGVDPMGPFWSLVPCPSGPQNIRLVVRNGEDPVLYTLALYLGHWPLTDLVAKDTTLTPVCSTMVTRWKKAKDVRRIPVREGAVRGVLFLPPGEGPHPGVIDMFGSAGGLMETRASLLASRGFAVLALPFFRFEDLPETLAEVTFDYFEEAVSWLSSHRMVKDHGIGIVGVSKGAEFALLMAWKCPQVRAVVIINGLPSYGLFDLHRKDGTLLWKALELDLGKSEPTEEGLSIKNCFSITKDSAFPVWESSAHTLMLVSDDDQQLRPELSDTYHSFFPEDRRHLMEVVHYPGAGHLLEPPYTPHCRACNNPSFGVDMLWGGNPVDHAAAQEDSWNRMLRFLQTHLC